MKSFQNQISLFQEFQHSSSLHRDPITINDFLNLSQMCNSSKPQSGTCKNQQRSPGTVKYPLMTANEKHVVQTQHFYYRYTRS